MSTMKLPSARSEWPHSICPRLFEKVEVYCIELIQACEPFNDYREGHLLLASSNRRQQVLNEIAGLSVSIFNKLNAWTLEGMVHLHATLICPAHS